MSGKRFENKVCIVSGSTQGVGKEVAKMLLQHGAKVVLNGRNMEKGEPLLQELSDAAPRAHYVSADVSTEEGCRHLIEESLQHFGRIDVLINNAGMSSYGDVDQSSPEVIRQVFNSNALGSAYLTHFAMPELKKNKGSLLFISSLAALHGLGGHAFYSAAKVAMITMAQSLRKELSGTGVYVGYTCLGFTENDEVKRTLAPDGSLEAVPKRPGIKTVPKRVAARNIVRQISNRKFRSVHSPMGKVVFILARFSEGLMHLILLQGYRSEKKFLTKWNGGKG